MTELINPHDQKTQPKKYASWYYENVTKKKREVKRAQKKLILEKNLANMNFNERWSSIKRRKYTYAERKINAMNDYELYVHLFGVDIEESSIHAIVEREFRGELSNNKLNRLKKRLEDAVNHERYDKDIQDEHSVFNQMLGLREGFFDEGILMTNSELICLFFHGLNQFFQGSVKGDEGFFEALQKIFSQMINDWTQMMDTVNTAVQGIRLQTGITTLNI